MTSGLDSLSPKEKETLARHSETRREQR